MPTSERMAAARERLRRKKEWALALGGLESVARHHAHGFLTARERIDLLLDPGTFQEVGMLAHSDDPADAERSPGDGSLAGYGRVGGRLVGVHATDSTIKGGSGSTVGGRRSGLVRHVARLAKFPTIDLKQGGGHRVGDIMTSRLAGNGAEGGGLDLVRPRQTPHLVAIMGNSYGPAAVGPSDFGVMTKASICAIGSPNLISTAIGEQITPAELGGWEVQSQINGQIDAVAEDDAEAIRILKEALSYFPANSWEQPPVKLTRDPWDRREEALLGLVPDSPSRAYDIRKLIRCVVDDGDFFELKPDFARGLVTGFARMAGHPVAIFANQPLHGAGALDDEVFVKARRLAELCRDFHFPMLFFHDNPGLLIGRKVEHNAILSKAMDYMTARLEADVPKVSIVVRKSYGWAYFCMNGTGVGRSFTFCWPSAQMAFMGPEAGAKIMYRRDLAQAPDPQRFLAEVTAKWREEAAPWTAAELAFVDDVIDPRDTRPVIIRALQVATGPYRRKSRPVSAET